MSTFTIDYKKIEGLTGGPYTRLLTLAASRDTTDPIHVSLTAVNLADGPIYEALSYCWGDATHRLLVFCDGKPFPVTENLESALRHLRLPDEDRVLWVDALCINQSDISERSYQVNCMREVYRQARGVLVWLGEADDDSDLVFPLCERMVRTRLELLTDDKVDINSPELLWGANKQQLLKEKLAEAKKRAAAANGHPPDVQTDDNAGGEGGETPEDADATSDETAAFLRLVSRPWFTRCWVLQEIALAREAVILCGEQCIDWQIFYVGFTLAIILGDRAHAGRPDQLSRGGLILMMMMREKMRAPEGSDGRPDLLWMLWQVYPLHATDPRDKVYSILGLINSHQSRMSELMPDYTIPVEECYKRSTLAIMSYAKNLDVLSTERPSRSTLHAPSWVPDWTLEDHPAPVQLFPDPSQKLYVGPFCAAPTSVDRTPVPKQGSPDTLLLSGHVYDRIVELEEILTVPNLNHTAINDMKKSVGAFTGAFQIMFTGLGSYFDTLLRWEKMALAKKYANAYPTGEDAETVLAITLCCGNIDPSTAVSQYRKWHKRIQAPKKLTFLKKLGIKGGVYKSLLTTSTMIWAMSEAHDRVYATETERTLYRRLARTERGLLAVVPSKSAVGDEISLFRGGRMPFVTRQSGSGGGRTILGPSYVHGIMYGEGWDEARVKEIDIV